MSQADSKPPVPLLGPRPQRASAGGATVLAPEILLVEDEPLIAEVFGRALQQAGHRVRVARDGMQALRLLRERAADLLVLDMALPLLSGKEILRRVRAENGPPLPILVVSATPRHAAQIHDDDLLPGRWLCKPLRPRDLVQAVAELLPA